MPTRPYDYAACTALITGASRGIGAEIARALARRGVPTLVLVARSRGDMDVLAAELTDRHGTRVEVLAADLSDADAPARIKAETDQRGLRVDLLVNNAGFGDYGFFDQRPLSRQEDMVAVNCTSLVALSRLYLPGMVEAGRGGIANIASTAGFQPVPFMSTYGATKAFVLSFSEALWAENHERGNDVRVVCVCPGSTDTAFDFGESAARGLFENVPQTTPEAVAAESLDALDANASYVVVGRANYVGALLGPRLLPRATVARMTARFFRPDSIGNHSPRSRRTLIAGAALAAGIIAGVIAFRRKRDSGTG